MERNLRKRTFEVIETSSTEDGLSRVYDFFMMGAILVSLLPLAGAYILIAALLIFNVEPDSFENFFDAVYWATVSLTTVGYGDIYPVSTVGRIVAMASSIFGIAIIALHSGIVTAGYLDEIRRQNGSGTTTNRVGDPSREGVGEIQESRDSRLPR